MARLTKSQRLARNRLAKHLEAKKAAGANIEEPYGLATDQVRKKPKGKRLQKQDALRARARQVLSERLSKLSSEKWHRKRERG